MYRTQWIIWAVKYFWSLRSQLPCLQLSITASYLFWTCLIFQSLSMFYWMEFCEEIAKRWKEEIRDKHPNSSVSVTVLFIVDMEVLSVLIHTSNVSVVIWMPWTLDFICFGVFFGAHLLEEKAKNRDRNFFSVLRLDSRNAELLVIWARNNTKKLSVLFIARNYKVH